MIYPRGECVLEYANSGSWELYMLYLYCKKMCYYLNLTYLLSRIKPADDPLPRSRYTLLRTRGVDKWVV